VAAARAEESRDRPVTPARAQANELALRSVSDLRGEVQASARQTLEALARGFGVESVELRFAEAARSPWSPRRPVPRPGCHPERWRAVAKRCRSVAKRCRPVAKRCRPVAKRAAF